MRGSYQTAARRARIRRSRAPASGASRVRNVRAWAVRARARHRRMGAVAGVFLGALLVASPPEPASAQTPCPCPTAADAGRVVTVVPTRAYTSDGLRRALVGAGWRDVWSTPVEAPVFEFDAYAGGVDWTRRGGRSQSITLHLEATGGWREYRFRSVDKFPEQALPYELVGTPAGRLAEDLIGTYFPAAPLLVPPFLEAVDVLHVEPELRVMPDDPRLEVYRDTFAGMLGTVEIRPDEAPDDRPGFAGSSKIKGTEEFLEDLDASKAHRLHEREFLAARLVDFLINDTDRSTDNIRFARYGAEGDYAWRPIPIDRDRAFVNADGPGLGLLAGVYPKYAPMGTAIDLDALTYGTFVLDRRLLQRLTREDFVAVGEEVRAAITDDVIARALARMPDRWQRETDAPARLTALLRARREGLVETSEAFYERLATHVDLHGTDEVESVAIERHADGRVRVTIRWPEASERPGEVHYERTFLPAETREVRVYLAGGDDEATITGAPSDAIVVRIVGGEGDDVVADEAGGGGTRVYAAAGDDELDLPVGTPVSRSRWESPVVREGWRAGSAWAPDWGGGQGWSPAFEHAERTGLVVGAGPSWRAYGFRRLPHHWEVRTAALWAPPDDGFGAEVVGDYRFENAPLALQATARATMFEPFRFEGLGNETVRTGAGAVVEQDRLELGIDLVWHVGWRARESDATRTVEAEEDEEERTGLRPVVGRLAAGPLLVWSDAEAAAGSPLARSGLAGAGGLTRGGLAAGLELDHTDSDALPTLGWRLHVRTAALQAGAPAGGFAESSFEGRGYLPLPYGGTHLALRAGAARVVGAAPVQHSPTVGGLGTLRGHTWQRFRGDGAAWGSAEARAPVTPVELLVRWDLGVFALADAGRVWGDGESPGGWHTAYGAGLWLEAFGKGVSLAWARGEQHRLHVKLGLPF